MELDLAEVGKAVYKPAVAGITAGVIDYTMVSKRPLRNTLWYAGAVAGGIFLGDVVYNTWLRKHVGEKNIQERTIEAVTGTTSGLVVDRVINGGSANMSSKALTILGAEMVGEWSNNMMYPENA